MPLVDEQGFALGSLCVLDQHKKQLTASQKKALKTLAAQVMSKLQLRKKVLELENAGNRINCLNELLTAKEQEAMQIIKHTPMTMALHTGMDMTIRFANDLMLQAWGKDETVFGAPFDKALPELAALDFPRTMRQCMSTGIPYEQKEAHMSYVHQGTEQEFYYNYAFTPLTLPNGKVWGLLDTALDVTNQVKAKKKAEVAKSSLIWQWHPPIWAPGTSIQLHVNLPPHRD